MKIIAHRANLNGPNINDENQISSINKCIDLGFDVDIGSLFQTPEEV